MKTYHHIFWGGLFTFFSIISNIFAQNNDDLNILNKRFEKIYAQKDEIKICIMLDDVFKHYFLDSLKNISTHHDSVRLYIVEHFNKKISSKYPQKNHFIQHKLALEHIKLKNVTKGLLLLKKIEKTPPKKYSFAEFYQFQTKFDCFSVLRKNDSALYYAKQMVEIAPFLKYDSLVTVANHHLGLAFYRNQMFDKSRIYLKKVIAYKNKMPDERRTNITLTNTIALSFKNEKNKDSALFYYDKGFELAKEYEDTAWQGIIKGNIGDVLLMVQQYEKAIPYLLIDLKTSNKNYKKGEKINTNAFITTLGIAEAYLGLNDVPNAKIYYDSAKANISNKHELRAFKYFYELEANYFEKIGNFKDAQQSTKQYVAIKDSIFNLQMLQQAKEINAQLDFDKQKAEIDKLHAQNLLSENENTNQKYIIAGVVIILFLSFLLIYFLSKANNHKKKLNKILASQKEEITSQAEHLKESNEKLLELSQFKETFTNMIVHDLKNPLNAMLNLQPHEIEIYQKKIHTYSNQMLQLVMNILDVQKFEETKISLDKQNTNFSKIILEAYNQVDFLAKEKNINIIIQNQILHLVCIDEHIILRVVINILTNALKYSPQNSKIEINIWEKNNDLCISIKDEGNGFPSEKSTLIFEKYVQLDNQIKKYRSTGLGLTYCKMAIEAHNGKIWAESELKKGATFYFTLPITKEKIENSSTENQIQHNAPKQKFVLLPENQKILHTIYEDLARLEVYYTSDLEDILSKIDFEQNPNLHQWHNEVKNAIYNFNQILYTELISLIKI